MPTYEYACEDCGHRFEAFQSISAEPITECPACNGHVKRLINGGIGLIFKGSGFYLTDYVRSDGTNTDKKEADKAKTKSGVAEKGASENKGAASTSAE